MKVNRLTLNDPGYPAVLANIPDAPKELFYTGAEPAAWLGKPRLAVVGSRKATAYGREVSHRLVSELSRAGVVIISGLALGIDSIAHQAALEQGGVTIAVLPTSLEKIYPASHNNLARQIIERGGTLISEYPAGAVAYKRNFTARNRIVTGLADALLITEAAARSGTLNTARYALEQGKTVMAVPGNITSPNSEGTNNLIKSGALPVIESSDVFFAMNIRPAKSSSRVFRGTADEQRLLEQIHGGISSQEELAIILGLEAPVISSLLTALELSGYIKPAGGGNWLAV